MRYHKRGDNLIASIIQMQWVFLNFEGTDEWLIIIIVMPLGVVTRSNDADVFFSSKRLQLRLRVFIGTVRGLKGGARVTFYGRIYILFNIPISYVF